MTQQLNHDPPQTIAINRPRRLAILAAILLPGTCLYVAALAIISHAWLADPEAMFQENAPATWLSVVLLFWASGTAWATRSRWKEAGEPARSFWTHAAVAFFVAALALPGKA